MSILLCTTAESHTFIATDPRMPSNINLRITTWVWCHVWEILKKHNNSSGSGSSNKRWRKAVRGWGRRAKKQTKKITRENDTHTQRFNIWKSLTVTYLHGFSSEKQNVLHNSVAIYPACPKVIHYMANIWTLLLKNRTHNHRVERERAKENIVHTFTTHAKNYILSQKKKKKKIHRAHVEPKV